MDTITYPEFLNKFVGIEIFKKEGEQEYPYDKCEFFYLCKNGYLNVRQLEGNIGVVQRGEVFPVKDNLFMRKKDNFKLVINSKTGLQSLKHSDS